MNKKIYVVIVTWNGMKWIEECLGSLRKSTIPVSTIVIDNGSTDSTVEFIKEKFPEVHVLETGCNWGFGKANNIGIRYALDNNGDYVYLLNQDAYVYPDMFERLLEVSERLKSGNVGIYSPLHVHGDRKSLDGQYKDYIKKVSGDMVEDLILNEMKDFYSVDCVPAAGWLLPIETIRKIGGFDPMFFHYGEDHNYAHRIKFHGMTTAVVPKAKMVHDRETFGNVVMYKKGQIIRGIETETILNINLKLFTIITKLFKIYILFVIYAIPTIKRGNLKLINEEFFSIFKVLSRINKYRKDRHANKQQGANWLYSDEIETYSTQIK